MKESPEEKHWIKSSLSYFLPQPPVLQHFRFWDCKQRGSERERRERKWKGKIFVHRLGMEPSTPLQSGHPKSGLVFSPSSVGGKTGAYTNSSSSSSSKYLFIQLSLASRFEGLLASSIFISFPKHPEIVRRMRESNTQHISWWLPPTTFLPILKPVTCSHEMIVTWSGHHVISHDKIFSSWGPQFVGQETWKNLTLSTILSLFIHSIVWTFSSIVWIHIFDQKIYS